MKTIDYCLNKSKLPAGPWMTEPDRVEWTTRAGLPAIVLRVESHMALCGYVAVPPGHPLHGKSYDTPRYETDEDGVEDYESRLPGPHVDGLSVHGGVTYAAACAGKVCHVAKPGEPDDVWWLGFDTVHSGDCSPMDLVYDARDRRPSQWRGGYRDLAYVQAECESLAEQLKELAK